MVPHIRVEEELSKLLVEGDDDDIIHVCVTAVPCEKKGERLVVLHTPTEKDASELREGLMNAGLPNLSIPSQDCFIEVDSIPILGTGKLDLKHARDLALERTQA